MGTISSIIVNLVFGLIVGLLARFVMPGRDPMGLLTTAVLGIAGSFLGTLVNVYLLSNQRQAGWILSIVGAVLLLFLYRQFAARRA